METTEIAGLKVSIWKPSSTSATRVSPVLFSHGFHGSRTQSKFLMEALANAGYVVFAPDHRDSGRATGIFQPEIPFENVAAWTDRTYADRADDMRRLIGALKKDAVWGRSADWSNIALAGHSLGGYTVLGLAGAWPSWRLPDVKAVLALSPYCSPLVKSGNLGSLNRPVMYQGGTRDFGITPTVSRENGAYDRTSAPTYFVEFERAGHLAWTDLTPQFHESINYYSVAFLERYLRSRTSRDLSIRRPDVADLRSKPLPV